MSTGGGDVGYNDENRDHKFYGISSLIKYFVLRVFGWKLNKSLACNTEKSAKCCAYNITVLLQQSGVFLKCYCTHGRII